MLLCSDCLDCSKDHDQPADDIAGCAKCGRVAQLTECTHNVIPLRAVRGGGHKKASTDSTLPIETRRGLPGDLAVLAQLDQQAVAIHRDLGQLEEQVLLIQQRKGELFQALLRTRAEARQAAHTAAKNVGIELDSGENWNLNLSTGIFERLS